MTTLVLVLVVAAALGGLALGAVLLVRSLARVERRARDAVDGLVDVLGGLPALLAPPVRADCHGHVGLELPQLPGPGALAATADALVFRALSPEQELVLPLTGIAQVEHAPRFVTRDGTTVHGTQLLVVHAAGPHGDGAIAWTVPDAAPLAAAIADVLGAGRRRA